MKYLDLTIENLTPKQVEEKESITYWPSEWIASQIFFKRLKVCVSKFLEDINSLEGVQELKLIF